MNENEYLTMFMAYPFLICKNGSIIFVHIQHSYDDFIKDLEKNKEKLKECSSRVEKLSKLLSSEFINKAPANIIEENCNKLLNVEEEHSALFQSIDYMEKAMCTWKLATEEECADIKDNFGNYKVFKMGDYFFAENR
jgi:hypothetical protein